MNKALVLLVGGDLAAAVLAYGLGIPFGTLPAAAETIGLVERESLRLAAFVLALLFSGFLAELYSLTKSTGSRDLLVRMGFSLTLSAALLSASHYFLPRWLASELMPMAFSLLVFGLLQYGWHRNFHRLLRIPGIAQKVMILGAGPVAEQIEKILAANQHNYIIAGFAWPAGSTTADAETVGSTVATLPVPEIAPETLTRAAVRQKIDKIVISLTERRGVLPVRDILGCKLSGIEIVDAMSFYEQITGKLMVEKITPSWFIFSNGSRVTPFMRFYKRIFDILLAVAGLIIMLPLLPFIALAIKLDSPGPVFFEQVRVGMGEKNFIIYKFRTMQLNAERRTGAVWAIENDPRVTRVGRLLRQTRLDEIPQLFNVLLGNMSLVGPRPERPEFVETLKREIPFYSNRHYVKPGATGWAQVNYSYGASMEDALEKLRYDLYYIKNYSIFLDFLIILETIKVVLFGRGAR